MRLVKSTTNKIINGLHCLLDTRNSLRFAAFILLISASLTGFSQDNSPYSRYGLGDLVPSTNVNSRGMGGIAAGYNSFLSINFNNPASYGSFQAVKEPRSRKMSYGRTILDVGINVENRTLREPASIDKFTGSNALFSHVQLGMPIRPNWGLVFGLRPVTRISYKMIHDERTPIDSMTTLSEGDGGAYLPSIGTGFRIPLGRKKLQSISFGVNVGYLFGKQDYSTRRYFNNDTVSYNAGNFETKTSYGNVYFNSGIQYQARYHDKMVLTLGVYGNIKQNLNATRDIIRETYYFDPSVGYVRLDSVKVFKDEKGKITYPGNYTAGFTLEKQPMTTKDASWLIGVDFAQNNWGDYRYYGLVDPTVRDKWEIRVGGQITPVPKGNYFSNVTYRAGFFYGPDYIYVNNTELPTFGASFGMELPVGNYNRLAPGQVTRINLALEYVKRGNNENALKENLFRLSVGFSLSDFWFVKKKYD